MKLVLMEFLSLDGVSQGPGSPDEDTSDGFTQGGWFVPHLDETFLRMVVDWVSEADAFLFGRRTYEEFARAWPQQTDPNDPIATRLNGLPKYVASHSLDESRVGADHHSARRHPRPGRGAEAATRSGTADPRQCPARSVAAGRRIDRRGAAGDRPGHSGPRPEVVPGRWRPGRSAVAPQRDDTSRTCDSRLRNRRTVRNTEPTARHDPGRGLPEFYPLMGAGAASLQSAGSGSSKKLVPH